MITTSSPSPTTLTATSPRFTCSPHYDRQYHSSPHASPKQHRRPSLLGNRRNSDALSATPKSGQDSRGRCSPASALQKSGGGGIVRRMVDASTQYSPPVDTLSRASITSGQIQPVEKEKDNEQPTDVPAKSMSSRITPPTASTILGSKSSTPDSPKAKALKRNSPNSPTTKPDALEAPIPRSTPQHTITDAPSIKRARPDAPAVKLLPIQYERCDTRDLVVLISSMLMELIRYNDTIPLRDGHLTRFHSRAAPTISVIDYLQRLTTHATLSPPILLSMVYYIDRLCALYPAFTISSLTVHRFLITSATVASKGLSDSFWTNKTYARVGGVSLKELALLELEFLWRVDWRIVPKPEVLVDYYRSLVDRAENYEIDASGRVDEELQAKEREDTHDKG